MITRVFFISILFLLGIPALSLFLRDMDRPQSRQKIFYSGLAVFSLSLYLHLYLSILTPTGDSAYFASVMTHLTEESFYGFYDRLGITYPPLFNYTFFLFAHLLRYFGIPLDWKYLSFVFCLKLPGMFCEFAMAALLLRQARKTPGGAPRALLLYLILLNPGYLLVTSYISQVDAIYTLFLVLTVCLIMEHRLKLSYFCFAAAILFKFQAVFVTPVLICAIVNQVILHDFSWKRFFSHLTAGLCAIACMAASYLPFVFSFSSGSYSEGGMLHNFTSSVESYGLASQNAYNFWVLVGYNWHDDFERFGPLSCSTWGIFFIILLVLLTFLLFSRNRDDDTAYPQLAALLVSGTFCFSVRMMARYLYPAVVFLVLAYAAFPTRKRLWSAAAFSIAFFLATGFNYLVYPAALSSDRLVLPRVIACYVIACFAWLAFDLWRQNKASPGKE